MDISTRAPRLALVAVATVVTAIAVPATSVRADTPSWPMGGQNYSNTRSNDAQTVITASKVSQLATKWTYTTHGDVSATPAVVGRGAGLGEEAL